MQDLFRQLGIDWRLLLTQGVNFFVLLILLTLFLYRPLLKLLDERRRKIELGLKGAIEAERRLGEIETLKSERLAAADREALAIVSEAEKDAKVRAQAMMAEAQKKREEVLADAAAVAERRRIEELERLSSHAGALLRDAISRAVAADPKDVDAKLVQGAERLLRERAL